MNVLVLQGSPKKENGNTHSILASFIDGMKEAGAHVDVIFTNDLSLQSCKGDFQCMFKTPGNCYLNDDMHTLYPMLRSADIWVFTSPVFFGGFTSSIRKVLERLSPLLEPFFETYNETIGHPWRKTTMVNKIVLVASCGSPELFNFDAMISELQCICKKCGKNGVLNTKFCGALLFQNAQDFISIPELKVVYNELQIASKEAGIELIHNGYIPPTFQNILKRNIEKQLIETIAQKKNTFIKGIIDRMQK